MDKDKSSSRELLFLHIVSMFQAAAMQQMGKIMDPVTGEVEKDLEHAKVSIDILEVLTEKTQGNLSKSEEEFLSKVLFELHMNYVDELKASEKTDTDESETDGDEAAAEGSAAEGKAADSEPDAETDEKDAENGERL